MPSCTAACLAAVAVANASAAAGSRPSRRARIANTLSAAVCVVSYLHYRAVVAAATPAEAMSYLYSDWYVTLPLLLYELWVVLDLEWSAARLGAAAALSILMVFAGSRRCFGVSWACLIGIYAIFAWQREAKAEGAAEGAERRYPRMLAIAFFAVWVAYGVVEHAAPAGARRACFAVLDLVCKGAFGLSIAVLI